MGELFNLGRDLVKDFASQAEREIPGVARFEDANPRFTKRLKADAERLLGLDTAETTHRIGGGPWRPGPGPRGVIMGQKRTSKLDAARDISRKRSRIPERENMPNVSRRESRRPRRNTIKSHSRNIRSNITMARPSRTVSRANQYAEIKRLAGAFAVTSGTFTNLSPVVQGQLAIDRIGSQIQVQDLQFGFRVVQSATALAADVSGWRVTIFQWMPQSSTAPTVADIFVNNGELPSQNFNVQRKPLYRILYDGAGVLCGAGNTAMSVGNQTTGSVKAILTPKIKNLNYEDGATTVGTTQIFCLFQGAALSGGATTPTCNFNTSLNFIDS